MARPSGIRDPVGPPWWRSAVIYQVYPRSFADSNGDGHGDVEGIIQHLDHLEWLGVDAIWLNPITPSPNADWGYDVADYTDVDPVFGDLAALDRLVTSADARGLRVLLDLVPNHTSDQHPWFVDARSSREAARRDWYVWADARSDGSPPNNWRSFVGGSAWTWDTATEQYYLHNFLSEQPDLNWWNEDVRGAFDEILRFWLDRGIDGFRIDVAHALIKDRDLRDNPPATEEDHPHVRRDGFRSVYNANRPEVHEVFRRWRKITDGYEPERVLLGETWVYDLDSLARFYGEGGDELHLALNVPFIVGGFTPVTAEIVRRTEDLLPPAAWPLWAASNHDVGRMATTWCAGDARRARAAMLTLLTLRGTPILYYGDEIGMPDADVPRDRLRDPVGVHRWPDDPGRDRARTPMQWASDPAGGFTRRGADPWLPVGNTTACNVADQHRNPGSMLHLCRDLIRLRRERPDLAAGSCGSADTAPGVWAWRRGNDVVVAVNLTDGPTTASVGPGTVLIATDRGRDGERVGAEVPLGPWEALVLTTR
jgi:alpha-glucosidase